MNQKLSELREKAELINHACRLFGKPEQVPDYSKLNAQQLAEKLNSDKLK